jgi:hypothetical protein
MRVLVLLLSTLWVTWPFAAYAQTIHKCMTAEGTAYQSVPCAGAASDIVIASADGARVSRPVEPAPTRAPESRTRRLFWRTSIAIGMSDDEVLNLPSWGRPSAITRSKSNRVWHEEWLYRWRIGGASRLSFANGRLTAVETAADDNDSATPVSLMIR